MTDPQKQTPAQQLLRAALEGDLARVRSLIDSGADTDTDSNDASEVLRRAENDNIPGGKFRTGLLETLVLHQQHGRINAAMYLAAFNGFDTVVDHFLQKSAQDPLTLNVALFAALRSGRKALAEKLLDAGADASFKKSLPLRAAIDSGDTDCVQLVLAHGAPRAEGFAYAASRGNMPMTALLLEKDDDIRESLERICRSLSDKRALSDKTNLLDIQSVADMMLAMAEARGDDMQREVIWLAFTAAREESAAMIEVILRQNAFIAMDAADKRNLFDVVTPLLFAGMQKSTHADVQKTLVAIIESGGAQSLLEAAVASGNDEWTVRASRAGADPRRNQGRALRTAKFLQEAVPTESAAQILQDMQLSTAALAVMDEKRAAAALADADALLQNLRQTDSRRGTTGLMAVIAAGRAEDLAEKLGKTTGGLAAEDFLAIDAHGYTALDRLADGAQQDWLFTPALWRGQPSEYHRLWAALPEDWRQERQTAHAALLSALDVEAQQRVLHDAAEMLEIRLPQRRKSGPRGDAP
ncbi:MAG: hypothetical protein Q8K65_05440 [Alphaproteobacteria bacterium]|nr:hypothetical protein [Alphaproteobacteria bacterium]